MNCQSTQRHILASDRLDGLAPPLVHHLATCPSCRRWHAQLVCVEQALPGLPIPPSRGPGRLLQRLREPATASPRKRIVRPGRPGGVPTRIREVGRQKVALAFALAASLLVFALGWGIWPHQPDIGSPGPLVVRYQVRRDECLRQAKTHRERVVVLADFAQELLHQALQMEDRPQLEEAVQAYAWVVGSDLVECARRLPPAERPELLRAVGDRLRESESEASRRAAELTGPRAESLRALARAARAGDLQLRALVKEA